MTNMASSGTFFFIVTAIGITSGNANNAFVKVECNTENMGEYGRQSLLECNVKTIKEVANAKIRVVTWMKLGVDHPLLVFNRGNIEQEPGYRFAEPSWDADNMNISLLITKTAVADDGFYECMVITDSGDDNSRTILKVRATYNDPTVHSIPEKITPNADSDLICNTEGGYPEGQLRWFDEHNLEWTKSAKPGVRKTNSGLFELSSTLPLLRGSTFSKYTCVVFNATGGKEGSKTFEISPTPEEQEGNRRLDLPSKIVAPVVVIGSLIVGLLLALLIYRRRSQNARRPSATPLMGGHRQCSTDEYNVEEGCCEKMEPGQSQDRQA